MLDKSEIIAITSAILVVVLTISMSVYYLYYINIICPKNNYINVGRLIRVEYRERFGGGIKIETDKGVFLICGRNDVTVGVGEKACIRKCDGSVKNCSYIDADRIDILGGFGRAETCGGAMKPIEAWAEYNLRSTIDAAKEE